MSETTEAKRLRVHQLWQAKLGEDAWNGWRALLSNWKIEDVAVPVDPNTPFQGYYRSKNQDKTFEPVQFFLSEGKWACLRPRRPERWQLVTEGDADWQRVMDAWVYISRYPISHVWYKQAAETGIWPDADARVSSEALAASGNAPPVAEQKIGGNNPPEETPLVALANKIANAKLGMKDYVKITSDDQMVLAKSLKNRLTELAGEAKKLREDRSRQHLDALTVIRGEVSPLVDDAEASARTLNTAYNAWETEKLRLAQVEAKRVADETAAQQLIIQANATAAMDAEAKGEPVDTTRLQQVPKVEPPKVVADTETKVRAGYGRAGSKKTVWKVTEITDVDALFKFMTTPKVHSVLYATLIELALRAKNAGLEPPGVTFDQEVEVKG